MYILRLQPVHLLARTFKYSIFPLHSILVDLGNPLVLRQRRGIQDLACHLSLHTVLRGLLTTFPKVEEGLQKVRSYAV
jgi:hypothetical protein